jgi:O-antigen/teichoic acid export membrane protein
VVGLIGVLLVIRFEGGLGLLVMALVGAPLIAALMNSICFFCVMQRDLLPNARSVTRQAVGCIARKGSLFLVLQIVVAVTYGSDNIIIAQMLGAAAVTEYTVPEKMFSTITMVLSMVLAPLWPAYGEAIARGDHGWVRKTLKNSLITAVGFSAALSLPLVSAGPWLIELWVGHAVAPPFLLLLGLGLWKVIEAGGNALAVFLNGAHVVHLQVIVATLTAASAIVLKLLLVIDLGVAAVVWATILSYFTFVMIPYALVIRRVVRTRLSNKEREDKLH